MFLLKIVHFLRQHLLLCCVSLLAAITSFHNLPRVEYIDWRVIALLFNLMLVVKALQAYKLLDWVALQLLKLCRNARDLTLVLSGICLFSSMLITNDVALLTFVPLSLLLCRKLRLDGARVIVIETLAANLGSSFTPLGNPQNLFLYSYFHLSLEAFFSISWPLLALSLIWLGYLIWKTPRQIFRLQLNTPQFSNPYRMTLVLSLLLLILLSVAHLFDYRSTTLIIVVVFLFVAPQLFARVDYPLLLLFVAFFILIGNLTHYIWLVSELQDLLATPTAIYWVGLSVSQLISNVPASVLLAPFSNASRALIWGVNVGGMGTLIASMASLISYRLYVAEYPQEKLRYLRLFSVYNIVGIVLFSLLLQLMSLIIR